MPCGMLTSARCHPGGRPVLTSARCHPGGRPVLTSAWPMLMSALTGKRVNGPGAHRLVSGSHQQEVPTCQCCVSEKEKVNELVGVHVELGLLLALGRLGQFGLFLLFSFSFSFSYWHTGPTCQRCFLPLQLDPTCQPLRDSVRRPSDPVRRRLWHPKCLKIQISNFGNQITSLKWRKDLINDK